MLCTKSRVIPVEVMVRGENKTVQDTRYVEIGVLDLKEQPPTFTPIHEAENGALHSPVYLGARPRPPVLAEQVEAGPGLGQR